MTAIPQRYRVSLHTETQPVFGIHPLDHVPAIEIESTAPGLAARRALALHIDSRASPPPSGTIFDVTVTTRDAAGDTLQWKLPVYYAATSGTTAH